MLKRKDLAKQFELVVKQEIIEHNKAIMASNLAVNKLNTKLDDLDKSYIEQFNTTKNKTDKFLRELGSCKSFVKDITEEFKKANRDQFMLNERNHKEISIIDESIETVHKNERKLHKKISDIEANYYEHKKELEALRKSYTDDLHLLKHKIAKDLKNLKQEILDRPSEVEVAKKEFMEKLSMHKIDNEGLIREIKVLKKTVFINEKKIEHLTTLMERQKTDK